MATPKPPVTQPATLDLHAPSTFESRQREREARIAGGDVPSESRRFGFRGGPDAENSLLVVTRVQQ